MTLRHFSAAVAFIGFGTLLSACSSMHSGSGNTAAPTIGTTAEMQPTFKLDRTMPVAGGGRWDYLRFDAADQVLYVSRSTHTQVLKPADGSVVADIADTAGVHGIAIAPALNRGFTSNGKANTVTAFDLHSNKRLYDIPVSEGPDSIIFDETSNRVFAMCGEGNCVCVIDPLATPEKALIATIDLGTGPEEAATDGEGRLYVNLEDESKVAVIDLATMKVITQWPLTGGENPSGIAIDRKHGLLFSGCRNAVMTVTDYHTGTVLQTLPIGHGVDGAGFDPGLNDAFASCGDGTLTVIHVDENKHCSVAQTVATKKGARTMTLDPATHTVYLPAAEFAATQPGERRPKMLDGTFQIVVVKP